MKYKVSFRVSNNAQIRGEEPWNDTRDDIIIDDAKDEYDAIQLAMDFIKENLDEYYEVKVDEIVVYDAEDEPIEMFDCFEAKAMEED